MVIVVWNM
ncbi:uncharacterized protein FTOL_13049 [Fusarium torulosum]|uniref:Uncharacterized protein n=1 Tax=Fusarium torulosum TaxID=33205 RepID=A0AAE8SPJ7_9HYPO|nr:uncharacterized protein FTOL_13049 [Fusarium torulosum]